MPDLSVPDYSFLAAFAGMLEEAGLKVIYQPASSFSPIEQLHVHATTLNSIPVPLRVLVLDSLVDNEDLEAIDDDPFVIQASAVLPFSILPACVSSVMEAVFLLNRFHPLCSFGVSAPDHSCYLSAGFSLATPFALDEGPALFSITAAVKALDAHTNQLHQLATGMLTFADFASRLAAQGYVAPAIRPALPLTTGWAAGLEVA